VEALPIPDELVDLQRALNAARTAAEQYGRKTDTEHKALFPPKEQWRAQIWPEDGPERAERAERTRLRAERDTLAAQIREHPVMVQARAEGCRTQTQQALQESAKPDAQDDQAAEDS
jgi:hypothetical protein